MIVTLKKPSTRYRDLTSGQLYDVIGIEADELRIINNGGRPFLYPPDLFSVVDAREPRDWVTQRYYDSEGSVHKAQPAPEKLFGQFVYEGEIKVQVNSDPDVW